MDVDNTASAGIQPDKECSNTPRPRSRSLTKDERNYDVAERELITVRWSVEIV
jgi:hypothetical protein